MPLKHKEPDNIPDFHDVDLDTLRRALHLGILDYKKYPQYGILIGGLCMIIGIKLSLITLQSGSTYWLILSLFAFPLFAPFAAVLLYNVSRQHADNSIHLTTIAKETYLQKDRQLPAFAALMIFVMLVWLFVSHMIFALFMSTIPFTNITTSWETYFTTNGIFMLITNSVVGSLFALIVFSTSVIGLPMLLDKEIDFVTAMVVSVKFTIENYKIMFIWAFFLGILTLASMFTVFIGLLVIFPVSAHASWHLYALSKK